MVLPIAIGFDFGVLESSGKAWGDISCFTHVRKLMSISTSATEEGGKLKGDIPKESKCCVSSTAAWQVAV